MVTSAHTYLTLAISVHATTQVHAARRARMGALAYPTLPHVAVWMGGAADSVRMVRNGCLHPCLLNATHFSTSNTTLLPPIEVLQYQRQHSVCGVLYAALQLSAVRSVRTTALVCTQTPASADPRGRDTTAAFVSCTGLHVCLQLGSTPSPSPSCVLRTMLQWRCVCPPRSLPLSSWVDWKHLQ